MTFSNTSNPSDKPLSMDEEFLQKLDSIIEKHMDNVDFGVDELATEIALSRSQLHRKLNSITGKSASRYIRSYKLTKAKYLLEHKSARVSEVSNSLGFSSPAYFTRVFTDEFGHSPSKSAEIHPSTKKRSPAKYILATLILVVLAISFYTLYPFFSYSQTKNSIAVLPFDNFSSENRYDYISDGITEDIIGQLAKIPDLKVISRTSSSLYKGSEKSVKTIANELNVETILEGSIRKEGEKIRIVAQLIDAKNDAHLWSETFDQKSSDFLDLQLKISRKIANTLKGRLTKKVIQQPSYLENISSDQYEKYMRARFLEYQYSKEVTYSAIQLYREILETSPEFGPGYSGIAACYIILGTWTSVISTEEALENISPNLKKAMELSPDFFHTQAANGMTHFFYLWNYDKAEESLKRSLELDPTKSIVRGVYIHFLNMMGRFDEAEKQWTILNTHDPNSLWNKAFIGESYSLSGKNEQAVSFYKQAVKDVPYHPLLHDRLGWTYLLTDSLDQSIKVIENAFDRFNIRSPSMIAHLGIAYHKKGEKNKAEILISELLNRWETNQPNIAGWIATYYAGVGLKEEALNWVEKAIKTRDVRMIWLKVDPHFAELKSEERFGELLKKAGF